MKLTVGGESYTEPLVVKMDPRIGAAPEDLAKQFALESSSVKGMNESFAALKQVQALRAQLKGLKAKAGSGGVAEAISALEKKAAALEGEPAEAFLGLPPSAKVTENLSLLNQHFAGLLRVADSADAAPTAQAEALHSELEKALSASLASWNELKTRDIPALNEQLKKAGLTPIREAGSAAQIAATRSQQ